MNDIWKCDRCGHETREEDGEEFVVEWLCTEGLRKSGEGACFGLVQKTPQADGEVNG